MSDSSQPSQPTAAPIISPVAEATAVSHGAAFVERLQVLERRVQSRVLADLGLMRASEQLHPFVWGAAIGVGVTILADLAGLRI